MRSSSDFIRRCSSSTTPGTRPTSAAAALHRPAGKAPPRLPRLRRSERNGAGLRRRGARKSRPATAKRPRLRVRVPPPSSGRHRLASALLLEPPEEPRRGLARASEVRFLAERPSASSCVRPHGLVPGGALSHLPPTTCPPPLCSLASLLHTPQISPPPSTQLLPLPCRWPSTSRAGQRRLCQGGRLQGPLFWDDAQDRGWEGRAAAPYL
jgi:hypothetical protein